MLKSVPYTMRNYEEVDMDQESAEIVTKIKHVKKRESSKEREEIEMTHFNQ